MSKGSHAQVEGSELAKALTQETPRDKQRQARGETERDLWAERKDYRVSGSECLWDNSLRRL